MSYMHAPCANCPFLRKGGVRLMSGRVKEITRGLLSNPGRTFACHKTTVDIDEDDEGNDRAEGPGSKHCGGALIFAEKNGNATQMMRIAERLGLYKPEKLKGKELVFDTTEEMLTTALDYKKPRGKKRKKPEPRDPCHVADGECEAPAGWLSGGAIIEGTEGAEFDCIECGQPVCGACSTEVTRRGRVQHVCNDCTEAESDAA